MPVGSLSLARAVAGLSGGFEAFEVHSEKFALHAQVWALASCVYVASGALWQHFGHFGHQVAELAAQLVNFSSCPVS